MRMPTKHEWNFYKRSPDVKYMYSDWMDGSAHTFFICRDDKFHSWGTRSDPYADWKICVVNEHQLGPYRFTQINRWMDLL